MGSRALSRTLPLLIGAVLVLSRGVASAQNPPADTLTLSLADAVGRARAGSEEVRIARSQVAQAEAQILSARSAALPQVNTSLGYNRTFASSFSSGGGQRQTLPDSLQFRPNPNASLEERVAYLERSAPNAGLGGLGSLFGNLPFGRPNTYNIGVTGSQLVYSGGRVGAVLEIARNFREATSLQLEQQTNEVALQVRAAYYQALLASQLETAAEAALAQAREFTEQERLRLRAGRASELDLLRAEVAEANLRPQLVQARNAVDLALLNLKRLVDIPLRQPVRLTTPLAVPSAAELARTGPSPEFTAAQRAATEAVERQVRIAEQNVRIARGARLPNISFSFNYGRQLFPEDPFQVNGDWRTDFSAGFNVSLPVFNGFRTDADIQVARQQLERGRLQLAQLREANQLLEEQAESERERARAEISARQQTVSAAERVYELTRLRYQTGISTQLEVSDARLALLQARVNLAQALATFYSADAQLIRSLGGFGGTGGGGQTGGAPSGGF